MLSNLKMKGFIIAVFLTLIYTNSLLGQNGDYYSSFLSYSEYYNSGDFLNAEKTMLNIINSTENIGNIYITAAFNNLGVISNRLGRYSEAIHYYDEAETNVRNKNPSDPQLAAIYVNKARIFTFQKSFNRAIEYFERSISFYQKFITYDTLVPMKLSTAYLNLGVVYYETGNFKLAFKF